jgi:hypothetical protein
MAHVMPVSYDVFESSCREHGYNDRMSNRGTFYSMYSKNGVKCEVKITWYTVGYGRTQEELDILEKELRNANWPVNCRRNSIINIDYVDGDDVMETFWKLVNFIETISEISARTRGTAVKAFSSDIADTAIWSKIARAYKFAIDNQHQHMLDDHRHMLCADAVDHLIVIGSSKNRTNENSYREHVVPCIMIHNRAIEMTMEGCSTAEVAAMIASNMMVVQITKEESSMLDDTLGLRTSMPEDWSWGDNPLARLKFANIELV